MEIKTKNGAILFLDEMRWIISLIPECEIIRIDKEYFSMKNINGILANIHKSILIANNIGIEQNRIILSDTIYHHYIIEPYCKISNSNFNELFNKYHPHIFANKEIIIKNAEYYLLKPKALQSYIYSCIELPLGYIIESIIDKTIPIAKGKSDNEFMSLQLHFLHLVLGLVRK